MTSRLLFLIRAIRPSSLNSLASIAFWQEVKSVNSMNAKPLDLCLSSVTSRTELTAPKVEVMYVVRACSVTEKLRFVTTIEFTDFERTYSLSLAGSARIERP